MKTLRFLQFVSCRHYWTCLRQTHATQQGYLNGSRATVGSISSRFGSPVVCGVAWGKEHGVTKRLEIEPRATVIQQNMARESEDGNEEESSRRVELSWWPGGMGGGGVLPHKKDGEARRSF